MVKPHRTRGLVFVLTALLITGCVQENNPRNLRMGDVTLGQQLIDLKQALDVNAVSEEEYKQMKAGLVAAASMCAAAEEDEEDSWFF